ncbi:hypothetical protein [Flavobacterium crassostreae]|uniref:Methyltransferase small domain-containing protein n=1 Tax=Flavobacterium crassostreae TaxID=1763534 RepID=A0A1B9E3S3_9FLAO|nr:hypothetical protein [Flavobacterium crassostreae]OCB76548.1 hypothetical protein LPBF_06340 [Flavobacterium crassostreae]
MRIKRIAVANYKKFCGLEGSQYIASEFALETILVLIEKFSLHTILELGLGIGSISDTVLQYFDPKKTNIAYFGTENNVFCLKALQTNVIAFNKLHLYSELNQIKNHTFDFIIIDGYDDCLNKIKNYCSKNAIIFIEGDRKLQKEIILNIFPKCKYVHVITLNKSKPYAHGENSIHNYVGGGQLIFTNPTAKMNLFWMQQKIKTFVKNKIRKYKSK